LVVVMVMVVVMVVMVVVVVVMVMVMVVVVVMVMVMEMAMMSHLWVRIYSKRRNVINFSMCGSVRNFYVIKWQPNSLQ
jgi:hypothetical protein